MSAPFRRDPEPTFAREQPFTVGSHTLAQLDGAGVNRKVLRTGGWRRTSHGQWAPVTPSRPLTTAQRIVDVLPLIPDHGALAGWAAAYVLGAARLDGLHPHTGQRLPIVIALGRNVGRSQHLDVRFSREQLEPDETCTHDGIPVTSPLRTAFDLARWADNLAEGVAAVDALLNLTDVSADLVALATDRRGWRGVPLARTVAYLGQPGAAGTWESRLRVVHQVEAGLPRPLVNPRITDLRGRLLGYPDLLDHEAGLVVEFDGLDHRERSRHSADNVREEAFEDVNLVVVRVDSLAYRTDRRGVVSRLQSGHRRGTKRDRARDGWRLG
ncbi:MAG: type IV toxin-antitoxin system AbiEi family antitoxin [Propionibacteriaceae bacterium]